MNATHRKGPRLTLIALIAIGIMLPVIVTSAEAARGDVSGSIGFRLPNGAISISVGNDRYHYHRGTYYRKGKHGYVVTRAPRGAIIRDLPQGYSRIILSGKVYYRYGGIYYRKEPRGYIVVDTPLVIEKEGESVERRR